MCGSSLLVLSLLIGVSVSDCTVDWCKGIGRVLSIRDDRFKEHSSNGETNLKDDFSNSSQRKMVLNRLSMVGKQARGENCKENIV